MLNKTEAREIGELARRMYRALDSRLPAEQSGQDFTLDKLARIQAKDALERILELVQRSNERSI